MRIEDGQNGYDILLEQIKEMESEFEKLNGRGFEYPVFVYFREKYDFDDWEEMVCRLEVENQYRDNEDYIWEWDFYEGEDEIELLGITEEDALSLMKPIYKAEEFLDKGDNNAD